MKSCFKNLLCFLVMLFIAYSEISAAIGQSAVITLAFPFGARATGLGETFTGIADNVDATFYNPAGLGQAPLANTWKPHYPMHGVNFTAIASKQKIGFGKREKIWLGTDKQGLVQYNGKVWTTYEVYLIEEDDNLYGIAEKFLNLDDKNTLNNAVNILKEANNIETNRFKFIEKTVSPHLLDSIRNSKDSLSAIEATAGYILRLDQFSRNATEIYGIIATKVDSLAADSLSKELVKVFSIKDVLFSDLVELKIPFTIAVQGEVTALSMDDDERVWVGTRKGLWRYDGSAWSLYTILDGLPSDNIIDVVAGEGNKIAVATDKGIGIFSDGEWKSYGVNEGLPETPVTAIVFAENNAVYAGTAAGLLKIADAGVIAYDTADGLLSSEIFSLFYDSEQKLWIGGKNGITVYDEVAWKRYKFPNSEVYCFAEYKPGKMWIGTNNGAITYTTGHTRVNKETGQKTQKPPQWKQYHSKNALKGNNVRDMAVHGKDVWLITEKAVNQYDRGEMQYTIFYEPLLPAFNIPDLWHANLAAVFPTEEWGTLGVFWNFLSFGENQQYDAYGRLVNTFSSYEFVFALCYGLQIKQDFSFGLNIKYAHSALAPGIDEYDDNAGVGRTFAVDAAILKRNLLIKNLSLGFSVLNMGPPVFYISRDEADPIPFTLRLGLAYQILQTPVISLLTAIDVDREIVFNEPYKQPSPFWEALFKGLNDEPMKQELSEIIGHWGIEFWYAYFIALRMGVMIDEAGSRRELSLGLGLKYGNFNIDGSYIHSPRGSEARDRQWRFSFIFSQ